MVHGILQFTPRIAFRCVLHRCESQDIRCRESFRCLTFGTPLLTCYEHALGGGSFEQLSLAHPVPIMLGAHPEVHESVN